MKITIEKVNPNQAVLRLDLDGISLAEAWTEEEDGNYSTSEPILDIIKRENIEIEEGLEKCLSNLNMPCFLELCKVY